MEEIKLFRMTIQGEIDIEAPDADKAIAKAREWVEINSGRLTYLWVQRTALIEPREGD